MSVERGGRPRRSSNFQNSLFGVLADLLFVVLPFVVLTIVVAYRRFGIWHLLAAPDWSLATAVLAGQAIVKLVAGVTASGRRRPWERTALIVTLLIVGLLVPSLVALALLEIADTPPVWLVILQFALFLLAGIAFVVVGMVGQWLVDGRDTNEERDMYTNQEA